MKICLKMVGYQDFMPKGALSILLNYFVLHLFFESRIMNFRYIKIKSLLFCIGIIVFSIACRNVEKKNLTYVEQQELAKGIRTDSLFLGLYLGMLKEDFLQHCWQMNKKGMFSEGMGKSVEYQFSKQASGYAIQMNFYPHFVQDKMNELPAIFSYKGLDTSNPKVKTETLVVEVKKLMEQWYGNDFFITQLPTGKKGYAQVKGNRRILIFVEKEFEVIVVATDLTVRQ
jgi:hypothetical protein